MRCCRWVDFFLIALRSDANIWMSCIWFWYNQCKLKHKWSQINHISMRSTLWKLQKSVLLLRILQNRLCQEAKLLPWAAQGTVEWVFSPISMSDMACSCPSVTAVAWHSNVTLLSEPQGNSACLQRPHSCVLHRRLWNCWGPSCAVAEVLTCFLFFFFLLDFPAGEYNTLPHQWWASGSTRHISPSVFQVYQPVPGFRADLFHTCKNQEIPRCSETWVWKPNLGPDKWFKTFIAFSSELLAGKKIEVSGQTQRHGALSCFTLVPFVPCRD